jgi:hypothetical protein
MVKRITVPVTVAVTATTWNPLKEHWNTVTNKTL